MNSFTCQTTSFLSCLSLFAQALQAQLLQIPSNTTETSDVTPPPSGAASPSTLGRERHAATISPKKRLHHQQTEQTKCPWLHCQDVGPLQTSEGPHSHDKCHSNECKLYKPIPNQTPMHLGRCHSCASQRHPETMHNITPPHKGAAALRRTKNGKESQQKIKSRNHERVGPAPTKASIITVVVVPVHNL